jgi:hypothetical protein
MTLQPILMMVHVLILVLLLLTAKALMVELVLGLTMVGQTTQEELLLVIQDQLMILQVVDSKCIMKLQVEVMEELVVR